MKHVEVFTWLLPPPAWTPKAKPYKSRWKMTVEEAAERGAIEPCAGTMEIRNQPETLEEISANLTSAWQKRTVKPSDTGGD
ncbi:MAG: hypothetical protein DCF26_09295 [Burkholderiales bacterium]|nr:MAG: hypothetical protein DCF26_09295 [Burkholderiales bacterium]